MSTISSHVRRKGLVVYSDSLYSARLCSDRLYSGGVLARASASIRITRVATRGELYTRVTSAHRLRATFPPYSDVDIDNRVHVRFPMVQAIPQCAM